MGTEETYLNIIQVIYDKPTANILSGEKLKVKFLLRSGKKSRGATLTIIIQHSFESQPWQSEKKKEIKEILARK